MNKKLKVLSLFDGISCARVAIERAGFEIERYCASEIDKYAIQIAQKNYPDTIQLGDVKNISCYCYEDAKVIPKDLIDILIGGSPCQDLSIAKKNREGLCGARSGLFWEYVRIRDEVKPKYFILENVNSMPKEAKETITEALGVEPVMINASLVSAQNRKRLFWVGKLVGDKYEQVGIDLPEDRGILLKDILEDEVEEKYFLNDKRIEYVLNRPKNFAVKINPEKTNTLRTNYGNASANETYVSNSKGKSPTLTTNKGEGIKICAVSERVRIRKLTPIECERLQGLPDNYTEGVSNTQRYKALGNAFNVDVVTHIINRLTFS